MSSSAALSSTASGALYHQSFYFVDSAGTAKPFHENNISVLKEHFGFLPLTGKDPNLGYDLRTHWILIPIPANALEEEPLLHYNYPLVDFLDVYQKTKDSDWQLSYQTGDMRSFDTRPLEARTFYFPLQQNVSHLLLRVKTEGSLNIPFRLTDQRSIRLEESETLLAYGLFFGALAIMCFYNLFVYLFTRDTSYFYYVSLLFFIALYLGAMSGFGYQWIWRSNGQWVNEHIQPISVGMILACVCLFSRNVLQLGLFFPALNAVLKYLTSFCFAIALVGFFLPLRYLIHLISFMPMLVIGLVIVSGVFSYRQKVPGSGLFMVAWSAGLFGALLFALHQLGVLPSHPLFVHGLKVGVLLNTVFLSFSLVSQINLLREEKEKAEEIAHENYRLALVDGLTGISNRRAFDHQYRLEFRRSQREKTPLTVLMVDVDYFKKFNDSYGHRKGDDVLRVVAQAIKGSLTRPADGAFRYGGEEFVVLLPDTDSEGAKHISELIVRKIEGLQILNSTSPHKVLTVSVGGATESEFKSDLLALLELADDSLYQAKHQGRNTYVVAQLDQNVRSIHALEGKHEPVRR